MRKERSGLLLFAVFEAGALVQGLGLGTEAALRHAELVAFSLLVFYVCPGIDRRPRPPALIGIAGAVWPLVRVGRFADEIMGAVAAQDGIIRCFTGAFRAYHIVLPFG